MVPETSYTGPRLLRGLNTAHFNVQTPHFINLTSTFATHHSDCLYNTKNSPKGPPRPPPLQLHSATLKYTMLHILGGSGTWEDPIRYGPEPR